MEVQVQEPIQQNQQELLRQRLYESVKHLVWVLEIKWTDEKGEEWVDTSSASMVDKSGYLLTCAHGDWYEQSDYSPKARPLCDALPGFRFDVDLVDIKLNADMCLFKVRDYVVEDKFVARLGSGNLSVCDTLFLVGHPEDFVGSGVLGTVAYPCTEKASSGFHLENAVCGSYTCDALYVTPRYRIFGHVWNGFVFKVLREESRQKRVKGKPREKYKFQKKLLAHIPIIQISNILGGFGTSGGPLFNSCGEIVGMMVGNSGGFGIGIHVVAIKEFLRNFSKEKGCEEAEETRGKGLSRGGGRKHKSEEPGL